MEGRTENTITVKLKPCVIQYKVDTTAFDFRDGVPELGEVIAEYTKNKNWAR